MWVTTMGRSHYGHRKAGGGCIDAAEMDKQALETRTKQLIEASDRTSNSYESITAHFEQLAISKG